MGRWVQAIAAAAEFMQQANPWTGEMSTTVQYSPAMLVLVDFVSRLHGVRRVGDTLEWNCRLPTGARASRFHLPATPGARDATLDVGPTGARLVLGGRALATVEGTCRLTTDLVGRPLALTGTHPDPITVRLGRESDVAPPAFEVAPDAVIDLGALGISVPRRAGLLSSPSAPHQLPLEVVVAPDQTAA